ncbi:serine/threonine protein kinase [Streptomyces sp. NPDC088387]|uniref:serine/threonine protein kinase n=1 Tax=Streptomyces sp. NPDC088387 TaxID=3365859 RepID=UPI0037FCC9B7
MAMIKAHVSVDGLVAGRYRLLDVVLQETNRVSWYGEDVEAGRPCLLTQVGLPVGSEEEVARRTVGSIMRTAEVMTAISPGRVARVVDAFEDTGTLWTVTEWVGGTPLAELLAEEGSFNYVRAARLGLELLDVLEVAHSEGITHGELSPGQLFVPERGPLVVTGFGLAGATLAPRLTAPSYASPEQARDERIGPAADLWALGALLYTMVEGRPPFRDRERPDSTLKGVDRLPLRTPLRAGPLAQVVQGLLRKNSRERLTRQVVREALVRVVREDPDAALSAGPCPRLRRAYATALHAGSRWSRRTMVAGTALAIVTVAVAVFVVTRDSSPDGDSTAAPGGGPNPSVSAPSASAPSAAPPPPSAERPSPSAPTSPSATPTTPPPSPSGLPDGFRRFNSPEGFAVALPEGWKTLDTDRVSDLAYRVTLGADDDPRTLAVTYSERVGPDPVAVWRDDVQPGLEETDGFERLGDIRPTTYQGRKAADMQWLSEIDGAELRTFGRGVVVGDGIGFSLRWTAPAQDWNDKANEEALETVLRTFEPPVD